MPPASYYYDVAAFRRYYATVTLMPLMSRLRQIVATLRFALRYYYAIAATPFRRHFRLLRLRAYRFDAKKSHTL